MKRYNDEPVYYCKRCLSLKIYHIPGEEDSDYCGECSSGDIAKSSIEEFSELYYRRNGHSYLDKDKKHIIL